MVHGALDYIMRKKKKNGGDGGEQQVPVQQQPSTNSDDDDLAAPRDALNDSNDATDAAINRSAD